MNQTAGTAAVEVFLSYSHKDEEFRTGLLEHLAVLQREHWVTVWHDRRIEAGVEWKGQIDTHLLSAGMVVLLVSPSFIASDYCYDIELTTALRRHEQERIPIIPILVRSVDWTNTPLAQFQALPRNGKPVAEWSDRDAAFRDIVSGLRDTLRPAAESGAIVPPQWWRVPMRVSWTAVVVIAMLLTFLSRVFFSVVTPIAPLDGPATVVVFAFWFAVCSGGKYIVERLRALTARRKARNSQGQPSQPQPTPKTDN